jgi:signal transduction histidine kinase
VNSSFARRLLFVTTLEIGGAFATLVIVGALLALNAYVSTVRADMTTTLDRVGAAIDSAAARDARLAGQRAAQRYPRTTVVVVLVDATRRVVVYQPPGRSARPTIDVRPRGTIGSEPQAQGIFARLVLGLVTAFGLTFVRDHVGAIDIIVHPNVATLVATVASYVPEFLVALAVALALAFALARTLTRQVLRPLVDVTNALERFASGDLTPQPIAADRREQLGSLAIAYNGAIAQMERAFAERERANAAMRQFIADAGHQLRTPLTVLRGFIAILRKGELRTPEDGRRILETMNRQSQIMGALIEKLMLLERWEDESDRGEMEPIDVGQLAGDVVAPIAEAQPARVVRVDPGHGELAAIDPSDFTHALANLVDNALKYTTGAVDVRVTQEGSRVVVTVADEGPGMTPAEVAHAFDRFFRGTRRDVDGSGLGLAIARRAIERAGGTLTLESAVATGSRVRISLPATGTLSTPTESLRAR